MSDLDSTEHFTIDFETDYTNPLSAEAAISIEAENAPPLTTDSDAGVHKVGSDSSPPTEPMENIATYPDVGVVLGVLGGTVLTALSLFLAMALLSAVISKRMSKTNAEEEKVLLISQRQT